MAVWTEAVELEVREVVDGAFSESVVQAMARADDLTDRYGDDAASAFWVQLQAAWEAQSA